MKGLKHLKKKEVQITMAKKNKEPVVQVDWFKLILILVGLMIGAVIVIKYLPQIT